MPNHIHLCPSPTSTTAGLGSAGGAGSSGGAAVTLTAGSRRKGKFARRAGTRS